MENINSSQFEKDLSKQLQKTKMLLKQAQLLLSINRKISSQVNLNEILTTIIEETTCISNEAARLEQWDGGAGEQLRAVLELHSLASSSSWLSARADL